MLLLTIFLIFILVAGLVIVIGGAANERHAQARLLRQRLEAIEHAQNRSPSEELALLRDELLSEIPALNSLLSRSSHITKLQRFLQQANLQTRAGKFLLFCACSGSMLGLFSLLFSRITAFGAVGAVAGAFLPFIYVSYLRTRRFHQFEELFPEAIELLARAVRAGHAFNTALEMIGTELGEPVGGEFRKLFEEQKFGLPLRDALLNLAERMPIVDVKFFVTAVMLQRETGGNLAEILDKLSYVIRERFKILRQVRVYTAQGRVTMMILMALPIGLVLVMTVVNKQFISPLFTDPIGHMLIIAGLTLQTMGYFLIRRIIDIKV